MTRGSEVQTLEKTDDLLLRSRQLLKALNEQIEHTEDVGEDRDGHESAQGGQLKATRFDQPVVKKPR